MSRYLKLTEWCARIQSQGAKNQEVSTIDFLFTVLKILAGIFVFGVIVLVHELGHFAAAKIFGVKVNEFAIGMGPKIFIFGKAKTGQNTQSGCFR